MTKNCQKFGLKIGDFGDYTLKRSSERISGRKSQVFSVNI